MNRAAHQHGVLESFILRHSYPKILTKLPARIFAAYRFLFMICHVFGEALDQQETENTNPITIYHKHIHYTQKSKWSFPIKSTIQHIPSNSANQHSLITNHQSPITDHQIIS